MEAGFPRLIALSRESFPAMGAFKNKNYARRVRFCYIDFGAAAWLALISLKDRDKPHLD